MKICWDNLEGFFLSRSGNISNGNCAYIEDICKLCKDPYLRPRSKTKYQYCSTECASKCPEVKKKIGKKVSGELNGFKGLKGYKNPNWKNGITKDKSKVLFDTYAHQIDWCEDVKNMNGFLQVRCYKCDEWFYPNRIQISNRIQCIKDNYKHQNNFYCSDNCKQNCDSYRQCYNWIERRDLINQGKFSEMDFYVYKSVVYKYTRKSLKYFKKVINRQNKKIGRGKYHIDHIFSCLDGFKNNIPPYIIGNFINLQVLSEKDNLSKGSNSNVSKESFLNCYFATKMGTF